jgi:thiol-disulfide isomerase/thioredoxin
MLRLSLVALLAACPRPPAAETDVDSDVDSDPDTDAHDTDVVVDTDVTEDTDACAPYGPPNRWWHTCVDDVPAPTDVVGWAPGDTLPDLIVKDQFGDEVSLHQFAGRLLIVDVSAVWCVPCQNLAPELELLANELADDEVTVITLLSEDVTGGPAVATDAEAWATEFALTGLVGWDPQGLLDDIPEITGYPSTVLVDPSMHVVETDFERLDADLLARAAAGTLGGTEVCDNGIDDEIDFFTDCQDPDCPETGTCALTETESGALAPCADAGVRGVDVWRVEVTGPSARLVVDTVDDAHKFEPMLQRAVALDDRTGTPSIIADDERACTFAPSAWQCPDAYLPQGTFDLYVVAGWGTGGDGACADPLSAQYALNVYGAATATLIDAAATSETTVLYGL